MISHIRKLVINNKTILNLGKPLYYFLTKRKSFKSKKYWENRYASGGNSGNGSYGRLAEYKANVINGFVKNNDVNSVLEFGCGDGNQLLQFIIPCYIGFDVSKKSIEGCIGKFNSDISKSFFIYDPLHFIDNAGIFQADATFSLDVIYHLIEDEIFEKYIHDLFQCSKRFVIIYSSNTDKQDKFQVQHVFQRKFTNYIDNNFPKWKLISKIKNQYPLKSNQEIESFANFYIFEKTV
jgi:SAM-dependent methyltransferase